MENKFKTEYKEIIIEEMESCTAFQYYDGRVHVAVLSGKTKDICKESALSIGDTMKYYTSKEYRPTEEEFNESVFMVLFSPLENKIYTYMLIGYDDINSYGGSMDTGRMLKETGLEFIESVGHYNKQLNLPSPSRREIYKENGCMAYNITDKKER